MYQDEKEYAGNYEIQQVVEVGRKRFVIGVDEKSEDPYMIADSRPLMGGYFYENMGVTADYLDALQEFINRQNEELEWVRSDRKERKSDGIPYDQTYCLENSNIASTALCCHFSKCRLLGRTLKPHLC